MDKRKRNIIPDNKRCLGRKIDGLRCTRSRKYGEFCKSHFNSLPNGRVDDGKKFDTKKKLVYAKNLDDDDNYITVFKKIINGKLHFIDDNDYIYINNIKNPKRIGKLVNKELVYFEKGIFEPPE